MRIVKTTEGYETIGDTMPSGVIVMWHGLIVNIPVGWVICDGNNGTPDLRAKFVRGAPPGEEVGGTGGEDSHIITYNEMPIHSHTIFSDRIANVGTTRREVALASGNYNANTEVAGGGLAHENKPVYYELIFIKKL